MKTNHTNLKSIFTEVNIFNPAPQFLFAEWIRPKL